jgi:hypothetical protein
MPARAGVYRELQVDRQDALDPAGCGREENPKLS